jgi:thiamine kinase-like enzyme
MAAVVLIAASLFSLHLPSLHLPSLHLPSQTLCLSAKTPRASRPYGCMSVEQTEVLTELLELAQLPPARRTEELTSGFCNWVYQVDLDVDEGSGDDQRTVVVKVFSPLAKLRLPPSQRGLADEAASRQGLGPRLLHRSPAGLITTYVKGCTLTEDDVYALGTESPPMLTHLADSVAALHASEPPAGLADGVILWSFMDRMLSHIRSAPETMPSGISISDLQGESDRMREVFESLNLPVVNGHGDLKPSNVMGMTSPTNDVSDICFIDFELGGAHYRGYDLFKLFRTSVTRPMSTSRDRFLERYVSRQEGACTLAELQAETALFEPLSWLEAAVFFFFAIREFPEEAEKWQDLAFHRWNRYMETRDLILPSGEAARALSAAQQAT